MIKTDRENEERIPEMIDEKFSFLNEYNLELVNSIQSPSFGNRLYYYETEIFNISFVFDRNELSVLLTPVWVENWIHNSKYQLSMELLIGYLKNDKDYVLRCENGGSESDQLQNMSKKLMNNLLDLQILLSKENFRKNSINLERFIKQIRLIQIPDYPVDSWKLWN